MKYKDFKTTKDFLLKHIGDMSQVAGTKRYTFSEGKAKGMDAVDIRTGGGLSFTVLPGCGMGIAWAEYKGVPFSYIAKTGIVSARHFEPEGMGWLRTFLGGLLTTCGLSNVGAPCEEDHPVLGRQHFGLHGRISNTEASQVCINEKWQGDELLLSVSGHMRESVLHGENLSLHRTIKTSLGAKSLHIQDVVENEGLQDQPLMLLYHINIGWPIIDKDSRFICNSSNVVAVGLRSKEKIGQHQHIQAPKNGEPEHLFFHDFKADGEGMTGCAIINPELELGVYLRYRRDQLSCFSQWKMMAESEYVVGMEPGNCNPVGRVKARKNGSLQILKPGERKETSLEIGILDSAEEINGFITMTESLK